MGETQLPPTTASSLLLPRKSSHSGGSEMLTLAPLSVPQPLPDVDTDHFPWLAACLRARGAVSGTGDQASQMSYRQDADVQYSFCDPSCLWNPWISPTLLGGIPALL